MDLTGDMEKAVSRAFHEWPGVLERDDLYQSLWVEILRDPVFQGSLVDLDPDSRINTLYQTALALIKKERDDYERFTGNVTYGLPEVRGLLLQGGLDPLRDNVGSNFKQVSRDPGSSDDLFASLLDLHSGMRALRKRSGTDWSALVTRYACGMRPTDKDGRERLKRAQEKLTTTMNNLGREISRGDDGDR